MYFLIITNYLGSQLLILSSELPNHFINFYKKHLVVLFIDITLDLNITLGEYKFYDTSFFHPGKWFDIPFS